MSALINDWENDNAYGKNPSKARPSGCWQVQWIYFTGLTNPANENPY